MAKIFLDANWVIDIAKRKPKSRQLLDGLQVFISPLSIHILCYYYKLKIPDKVLAKFISEYYLVEISSKLFKNALHGPTSDLEDNIQLHSAAEADCDFFLTNDKKLLKIKFFGKTHITNKI